MVILGNLNIDDTYLQRLGKLVPVYVLAFVATVDPLLEGLDELFKWIGVSGIWAISLILFYVFEVYREKVTNKAQLGLAFISTCFYLGLLTINQIELNDSISLQVNTVLLIFIMGWTFVVPELSRKITKS